MNEDVFVLRFELNFVFVVQHLDLCLSCHMFASSFAPSHLSAMKSVLLALDSLLVFTSDSLLAQCRPDFLHLPTTIDEHCSGDCIPDLSSSQLRYSVMLDESY